MDGCFNYSEETRMEVARLFALGLGAKIVATHLDPPHGTGHRGQDSYPQGHVSHSDFVRNQDLPQQHTRVAVEKFLVGIFRRDMVLEFGISLLHFWTYELPSAAKTDQPILLPSKMVSNSPKLAKSEVLA